MRSDFFTADELVFFAPEDMPYVKGLLTPDWGSAVGGPWRVLCTGSAEDMAAGQHHVSFGLFTPYSVMAWVGYGETDGAWTHLFFVGKAVFENNQELEEILRNVARLNTDTGVYTPADVGYRHGVVCKPF